MKQSEQFTYIQNKLDLMGISIADSNLTAVSKLAADMSNTSFYMTIVLAALLILAGYLLYIHAQVLDLNLVDAIENKLQAAIERFDENIKLMGQKQLAYISKSSEESLKKMSDTYIVTSSLTEETKNIVTHITALHLNMKSIEYSLSYLHEQISSTGQTLQTCKEDIAHLQTANKQLENENHALKNRLYKQKQKNTQQHKGVSHDGVDSNS